MKSSLQQLLLKDPFIPGMLLTGALIAALFQINIAPNKAVYYGMIVVAQIHFVLAYFFLLTASSFHFKKQWKRLTGLALLSFALIWLYLTHMRAEEWLKLVYLYFIWHMLRDEIFFRNPKNFSQNEIKFMNLALIQASVCLYILFAGRSMLFALSHWPVNFMNAKLFRGIDYRLEIFAVTATVWLFMFFLARRLYSVSIKALYEKIRGTWLTFFVFYVLAASFCLFQVPTWLSLNAMVIYHVISWFIFSIQKYAREPSRSGRWQDWARSDVKRFLFVYIIFQTGMSVLFVFYYQEWQEVTPLRMFFHPFYFPAWQLFHITLSFLPERKKTQISP